jgi:hypothetical protein
VDSDVSMAETTFYANSSSNAFVLASCRRAISSDWPKSASASSTALRPCRGESRPAAGGARHRSVLSLLGERDAASESAEGVVVAPDLGVELLRERR